MNSQQYWEERAILKDKLLEKDINKLEKKLLKSFKDTRKEVLNELKIIYADIETSEYAKYRIDSLLTSINNALNNLYFIDSPDTFPANCSSVKLGICANLCISSTNLFL